MLAMIDSTRILLFVGVAILLFGLLKDAGFLDNVISVVKEWVKYLKTKKDAVLTTPVTEIKKEAVATAELPKLTIAPVSSVTTPYLVKEWLDLREGFDKAGVSVGTQKLDDMFILLNIEKKG